MTIGQRLTSIYILFSKYRPTVIVIVLGVIVTLFWTAVVRFYGYGIPTPTPTPIPKQIGGNSLPLKEIWRQSIRVTLGYGDSPKLLLQNELIILAVEAEHADNQRTIALDCQTGTLVWETKPVIFRPDSIISDENKIYVGYSNYVKALDLKTGQELWQGLQQSEWKKGSLYVYVRDKQLEVYDIDMKDFPVNTKLWILDSSTGETLNKLEIPTIFFQDTDSYYLSNHIGDSFGAGLIAEDKATGAELWLLHTTSHVKRWPIIIDDLMYLDAGDVYAVNLRNGKIRWLYKDAGTITPGTKDVHGRYVNSLISKIAYGKDVLYFVKSDGTIVGLNPDTGQEIGKIEVSPPPVFYDEEGFLRQGIYYLITASDKYIAAYYGDSQELIVFERTDVSP
jgi:outer membrane protein assembly factor BamB